MTSASYVAVSDSKGVRCTHQRPKLPNSAFFRSLLDADAGWTQAAEQFRWDESTGRRLRNGGFTALDRDLLRTSWIGLDPFESVAGDSRYLVVDSDYAVILLPAEGRVANRPLSQQLLWRYLPHFPVLAREPSAIYSLGAIRGHLAYKGEARGNYFEPIELSVSSRVQLEEMLSRVTAGIATRPGWELWLRGQPAEYLLADLVSEAERGICPWRSYRDPSLVPSLYRQIGAKVGRWEEYAEAWIELGEICDFVEADLEIPPFEVASHVQEYLAPFEIPWIVSGPDRPTHHYSPVFRSLQKLFFLQHYGLPSTVLDLTRDLDTALFFAKNQIRGESYVPVGPDARPILLCVHPAPGS